MGHTVAFYSLHDEMFSILCIVVVVVVGGGGGGGGGVCVCVFPLILICWSGIIYFLCFLGYS